MASDSFVGEHLNPSPYKEQLERAEKAEQREQVLIRELRRALVDVKDLRHDIERHLDALTEMAEENVKLRKRVNHQRQELRNLHKAHETLWKVLNLHIYRDKNNGSPART